MTELTEQQIIDLFKDAPEGATHYDTSPDVYPWLKKDQNGNKYWHNNHWTTYRFVIDKSEGHIPKPLPSPTFTKTMADAGELPSVGMECLYKERGGINWRKCKIIAIHNSKVWLENLETNSCPLNNVSTLEFKPLTPPIELIDGKAYQFDYHDTKSIVGIYHNPNEDGFAIFRGRGGAFNKELVKNIQLLEVKS